MRVPQTPLGAILQQRDEILVDPTSTYSIAGVYGFGKGIILRDPLVGSETKYWTLTPLSVGDVVYSKVKAFEGAVTVVPPNGSGRFVSPEFPVFSVADSVDSDYLRHLLASEGFLDQLRGKSSGIGARRERVNPSAFLGIKVPLPDLPVQHRLATHLNRVEDRLTRVVAMRSEALSVVDSALVQLAWDTPLRAVMHEDLHEVVIDPSMQYRQLGVFGMGRGIIDRGNFSGADTKYSKMLRVRSRQVVLSRLKAFEGAVAIAEATHDGALVSKEFPTFTLSDGVDPQFVRAVLTGPALVERLRANSVGVGARRERVDAHRFLSIEVPLPRPEIQRSIGRAAERAHRVHQLQRRSDMLASALVAAARNEVFSSLR